MIGDVIMAYLYNYKYDINQFGLPNLYMAICNYAIFIYIG